MPPKTSPSSKSARRLAARLGKREAERLDGLRAAERAWEAGSAVRLAHQQLAARYKFAAGYIGSVQYGVGRQLERTQAADFIGPALHEEPEPVFLGRQSLLEHSDPSYRVELLAGWPMERIARAVCDRWVRWAWMESLVFIPPVGLEELERCIPQSDMEAPVRDLYFGLIESTDTMDQAIEEMTELWLRLGHARHELAGYFERLVDHLEPEGRDVFIARFLERPLDHDPLDCLITKDALARHLGVRGAKWVKTRRRGAFPEPVHRAPGRSGYGSLFRVEDLLLAFEKLADKPLDLGPGIEEVVLAPDQPPPWEEKLAQTSRE